MEDDSSGRYVTLEDRQWPFLLLYDEEICRIKDETRTQRSVVSKSASKKDGFEVYIPMRFFGSVKGFHEGSLDLTGRHEPRYTDLMSRWNLYIVDFITLGPYITTIKSSVPGTLQMSVVYQFINKRPWNEFQTKWGLPEEFEYGRLLEYTQTTLKSLAESPIPKFQKLCLLGLPVELFEQIFRWLPVRRARSLSAACRKLRQVGWRFTLYSRMVYLGADPYELDMASGDPEIIDREILLARTQLLEETEFLLSRDDLICSMFQLDVGNYLPSQLEDSDLAEIKPDFYTPITRNITRVLWASTNLTELNFFAHSIIEDYFVATSQMKSLHTVKYESCTLSFVVLVRFLENAIPQSKTVFNLTISIENEYSEADLWAITLAYPCLRTLFIKGSDVMSIFSPEMDIQQCSSLFRTLERLNIHSCSTETVLSLVSWMSDASSMIEMKLTHFKLHTDFGIADGALIPLIETLRRAPHLKVLSLHGPQNAPPSVFYRIGQALPDLEGLTLAITRKGGESNKYPAWLNAPWEYAVKFSQFNKLKYFAWNAWPGFESGGPPPAILENYREMFQDPTNQDLSFEDGYSTVGPFLVNCPTLRFFVRFKEAYDKLCYTFSETATGGLKVESCDMISGPREFLEAWDPLHSGWRPILPK